MNTTAGIAFDGIKESYLKNIVSCNADQTVHTGKWKIFEVCKDIKDAWVDVVQATIAALPKRVKQEWL